MCLDLSLYSIVGTTLFPSTFSVTQTKLQSANLMTYLFGELLAHQYVHYLVWLLVGDKASLDVC